ncbi:MAG: DNA repair protein RadC [Bacteroidota bacterium]
MTQYPNENLSIKAWAEADRPREKLLHTGRQQLSKAELLAILIGSGTTEESALHLAQRILKAVEHDLHELGKQSIAQLTQFKGIGPAKAVTIAAALELGRRRQLTDVRERPQIKSSSDAFNVIAPLLMDLPHEEFWLLLLNRANRVLSRLRVSSGGITGTVVDARVVFRKAIEGQACTIILTHNHPSGNLNPSQADIDLTKKLKAAGQTLDINVIDHLIISEKGYYSFADEGKL